MLPHQMQIALRFAPVVAEQAPPGPGNGETAFADFTSRMQPQKTRLHGSVRLKRKDCRKRDPYDMISIVSGKGHCGNLLNI